MSSTRCRAPWRRGRTVILLHWKLTSASVCASTGFAQRYLSGGYTPAQAEEDIWIVVTTVTRQEEDGKRALTALVRDTRMSVQQISLSNSQQSSIVVHCIISP